jgi:ribosomal protein L11 methyltransferase
MFSLELACTQETKDLLIAEVWELGSSGVVELDAELDATHLRVFFDDDSLAPAMSERFKSPAHIWENIDWVAESRQNIEPMEVGEKFFLVPQWRDDPTPAGRLRIEINNGLAFGTGRHETTRLCLEFLEQLVRPGMTVLDIGTGSGILAQAAKLLGAGTVIACDIDPLAVEVAAAAGLNAFIGSAQALASGRADLLVANISPEALRELADEFPRLLKSGAHAILSGVEVHDQIPFPPIATRAEGTWRAHLIQKPSQT